MTNSLINSTPAGLYIVATPIGNLADISERAINILKSVDLILAEDTRHFKTLATRYAISTPVESYHDAAERGKSPRYIEKLKAGATIALVSDAGTPLISDPGFILVRAARANRIPVFPVPGASAAIAALSVSGMESDSFFFQGFLPERPGKKKSRLKEILEFGTTVIIYESPYRIIKTLEQIIILAPTAEVFIAREITKLHEEYLKGDVATILTELSSRQAIKGEIVLIVNAKTTVN
ncbi:16S rRNA (cytidine(1402)-2'-O)-methyltransferase [bacterium]|nr:16S rRNA (cytidine(1402)-2'-O)-methyltransferase [bacterium]